MVCKACGVSESRIRRWRWSKATAEQLKEVATCQCGGEMERKTKGPTAHRKETLDNGVMAHGVERFVEAQEWYTERADDHTKKTT